MYNYISRTALGYYTRFLFEIILGVNKGSGDRNPIVLELGGGSYVVYLGRYNDVRGSEYIKMISGRRVK